MPPPSTKSPGNPERLFQEAVALHRQGKLREAEAIYARVASLAPRHVEALYLQGVLLLARGQAAEATAALRAAAAIVPSNPDIQYSLGNALFAARDFAPAIQAFRTAVTHRANFADAWGNLGHAHGASEQWAEAAETFQHAMTLTPAGSQARKSAACNLAVALHRAGKLDAALARLREAIEIDSASTSLIDQLARWLLEQKPDAAAAQDLTAFVKKYPNHARGWANLATVLFRQQRISEAEAGFRRAVSLAPTAPDLRLELGNFLATTGLHREALAEFEHVASLDATIAPARLNAALMKLVMGDFTGGLAAYEARLETDQAEDKTRLSQARRWTKAIPLKGNTLFVHAEQGLGDTIQFARYIPLLRDRGADVVFEVHPPLKELLATALAPARVIAQGEPVPPFHFYCPLLSLAHELGTRVDSIPASIAITAPVHKLAIWAPQIAAHPARRRIGIVWSGNPNHVNDRNRSISLSVFRHLIDAASDCHFFSLQKNPTAADSTLLASMANVSNVGPQFVDFADTAAVIASLDAIVTVDTSVAHLAGTMGKPVSLLLPLSPDWRWLLERSDTPWYPTVRLIRQTQFGRWDDPVGRVAATLASLTV